MIERWMSRREELMDVVNYLPSADTSATVLRGLIKDRSQSGICLMTLQQGQEIMVDSIVVPSSKRAVVRWEENVGSAAYKTGLEFKR